VLSLLLLFISPLWIWELNEHWSVLPAAELAQKRGRALVTPNPWRFSWRGKAAKGQACAGMPAGRLQRYRSKPDGAIPADFLLIRQEPSGLPAALLTDGTLCRLEAVADQSWQRWRCSTKAPDF